IVDNHVSQDRDRVMPLTTIVCLHPAVGRRSYRNKKRFLWPPPMVYVHSTGGKMLGQEVTMTVIPDVGESSSAQRATLDEEMKCSFGSLYLKAPGAKTMHLSLEITNRFPPTTGDIVPRDACSWVTLNSGPISLLCPFTKQPPRTVNPPDCLVEGRPLALFSRLDKNSPVKYMVVERTELRASEMAWSAFNVRVVAGPPPIPNIDGPQPVMFGSSIILSDALSGFSTPPLKIRRVENGQVSDADGRPVTHMQKFVLEGLWPDGSRGYVAAVDSGRGKSQKRGGRFSHRLFYQSPSFEQTMEDSVSFITEYVDQSVCWMIVGLAQFEYTFFDASSAPPLLARNSYALALIEMPALAELMKALEQDVFPVVSDDLSSDRRPSPPADNTWSNGDTRTSMVGRSLPLLFIRPLDGVVYHSGRSIACEKISNNTPLVSGNMTGNPLNPGSSVYTGAAASGFDGWTVRVM
ncbi:beta-trefoil DNA-binding domain-containing protein, partial [Mycena galericulata]